jgi:phthalate 4,5-cis-dihydrodiol dehydrogenase
VAKKPASGTLNIGVAGLGTAGRLLIPSIEAHPQTRLAAVADLVPEARESYAAAHDARACSDLDALLALDEVDAVYIATPTHLHRAHVMAALAAGKHVLVEKPMAPTIEEALAMTEAAERAGRCLVVGHSHGYDLPVQAMREIIASGELGRLRLINTAYYSDWFYRPRLPEELDTSLGGGVTFRQGSHQFDVIRILGGGMLESIRATTFDWDPKRSGIGAYTAYCTFADGAVATATYNGYGLFHSFELHWDVGELGYPMSIDGVGEARRAIYDQRSNDERDAKRQRIARHTFHDPAPYHNFFGLTIVSCERGDIRQSPEGLYVYTLDGRSERKLPVDVGPRDLVLAELYDTIMGKRPPLHDGWWGVANVEVCLAVVESSRTGREIRLVHQVAAPEAAAV